MSLVGNTIQNHKEMDLAPVRMVTIQKMWGKRNICTLLVGVHGSLKN